MDLWQADMVSVCDLHHRRTHIDLVLRCLLLGHVPVYAGRQSMATYQTGPLHRLYSIPLGQLNLEYRSRLFDSFAASGAGMESPNEHRPEGSDSFFVLPRLAVSSLFLKALGPNLLSMR